MINQHEYLDILEEHKSMNFQEQIDYEKLNDKTSMEQDG